MALRALVERGMTLQSGVSGDCFEDEVIPKIDPSRRTARNMPESSEMLPTALSVKPSPKMT